MKPETDRKHGAIKPHTVKTLLDVGKRLVMFIGKAVFSTLVAWLVSGPLIKAAAEERGYTGAYGGEWLLIFAAFALTYYLAAKAVNAAFYPAPKPDKSKF